MGKRGEPVSASAAVLHDSILRSWDTNNRITIHLVERLPPALWAATVPGLPRRTVRMIAAHIHNTRRSWIRTLGEPHGIPVPAMVDRHRVTPVRLVPALRGSGRAMGKLLALACDRGGRVPPTPAYRWRNLGLDVGHVLTYFVTHEGHHRGQIVLAARQLGLRLPYEVTNGLWEWRTLS